MPQVPYSPVPTAQPTTQGTPYLRPEVPGAAFGETVGIALQHLGATGEKVGGELWQRAVALQDLKNETEATRADAAYMEKAGNLHAEYSSLQGDNATAAFPKYRQDLQEAREQIRGTLSNDMARKMYDRSSLYTMGRSIFNGAGHAAVQNKIATIQTFEARGKAIDEQIAQNYKDPAALKQALAEKASISSTIAGVKGLGNDWRDEYYRTQVSSTIAHSLTGMAWNEPNMALKEYEDKKSLMTQPDQDRVLHTIQSQVVHSGSQIIADKITAELHQTHGEGYSPESLPSMLKRGGDEVRRFLEESGTTDPVIKAQLPNAVEKAIATTYHTHKNGEADAIWRAGRTIQDAIVNPPNGQPITNMDALRAIPGIKDALAMDPTLANKARTWLAANAATPEKDRTRYKQTDAGLTELNKYYGQAYGSGEGLEQFLSEETTHAIMTSQLPTSDRQALLRLQAEKRGKDAAQDPRFQRAIENLRAIMPMQMEAAGVYRRTENTKEAYDRFSGALMQQLIGIQSREHRPANAKEIEEVGRTLLRNITVPGIIWNSTVPLFNIEVPHEKAEEIKRGLINEAGIADPSEQEIRNVYIEQFAKALAKKGSQKVEDAVQPRVGATPKFPVGQTP